MQLYQDILLAKRQKNKLLAILIDPEKFEVEYAFAKAYLKKLPPQTTHILVGGSTDGQHRIPLVVNAIKQHTNLPVILFPGSYQQITPEADGILFLSLLSGRNPEYLIGQQVAAAPILAKTNIEVIPTGYLLIDGGSQTAVARVSNTQPMSLKDIQKIVDTALAGQLLGKKCIYLEAGSGAQTPIKAEIIQKVNTALSIPLIVGGGIRSHKQMETAFAAGASMVVIGTAFEDDSWNAP